MKFALYGNRKACQQFSFAQPSLVPTDSSTMSSIEHSHFRLNLQTNQLVFFLHVILVVLIERCACVSNRIWSWLGDVLKMITHLLTFDRWRPHFFLPSFGKMMVYYYYHSTRIMTIKTPIDDFGLHDHTHTHEYHQSDEVSRHFQASYT